MITELNDRAQGILRFIIDSYMKSGEPVGSRTIARGLGLSLSSATIRNVMADLEEAGLLYAPHTSAGRLPTQQGLRLYVDGLMEIGDLSPEERRAIEAQCEGTGQTITQVMERATSLLSGLSSAASLVVAPKTDKPLKQIQFTLLERGRALVILVMKDGMIENRVMEVPADVTPALLTTAANYLNARLTGKTLAQAQRDIFREIEENRAQIDLLTADLVKRGLALTPQGPLDGHIIIRGQSIVIPINIFTCYALA